MNSSFAILTRPLTCSEVFFSKLLIWFSISYEFLFDIPTFPNISKQPLSLYKQNVDKMELIPD